MPDTKFKIGSMGISFPDENQSYFSIFEDLAKLFGKEYQSHAVKLLRAKIKELKPKPSIDYESDYTYIRTSNVDTLLSVINIIFELTIDEYRNGEVVDFLNLKIIFENAKKTRPKPKVWATGDVFSIPLIDDTFTFGQVLDKKYCTCALFNFKSKDNNINRSDFEQFTPLSILHLSNGDLLNNGAWQILFNEIVKLNPNEGSGGKFGTVGSVSYGRCRVLTDLANAYWGLQPWNILYKEDYYDGLLLKNVPRPKTAIILNPAERKEYRRKKFGVD